VLAIGIKINTLLARHYRGATGREKEEELIKMHREEWIEERQAQQ
jgi:hypothetical protein